jgi:hypothetical protein
LQRAKAAAREWQLSTLRTLEFDKSATTDLKRSFGGASASRLNPNPAKEK